MSAVGRAPICSTTPWSTIRGCPRAPLTRAVSIVVDPRSVQIDPAHDFGKNTLHSLVMCRTPRLVK
jgi:hypothetical protein